MNAWSPNRFFVTLLFHGESLLLRVSPQSFLRRAAIAAATTQDRRTCQWIFRLMLKFRPAGRRFWGSATME
jgi:hypothetical protein